MTAGREELSTAERIAEEAARFGRDTFGAMLLVFMVRALFHGCQPRQSRHGSVLCCQRLESSAHHQFAHAALFCVFPIYM